MTGLSKGAIPALAAVSGSPITLWLCSGIGEEPVARPETEVEGMLPVAVRLQRRVWVS